MLQHNLGVVYVFVIYSTFSSCNAIFINICPLQSKFVGHDYNFGLEVGAFLSALSSALTESHNWNSTTLLPSAGQGEAVSLMAVVV